MKSTHKRNVTAMQAAPRCQSNTAAGLPCKKPALKGMPLCQSHAFWPAAPKPRAVRAADQRRAYVELQQEIRRKVRDIERLARWARLNEVPDHFIDSLSEIGTGLAELAEADAPKRNTAGGRPRVNAEAPNPFRAGSSAQSAAKPSIAELSTERTRDRALGAMLGLAVGEAFGVTTAGFERGTFREMTEMYGQGKLGLNRGEWAWDTAAMLALTDTLLENPAFDAREYLERLVEHRDHRSYSPGSKPIRPGNMTALALSRFEQFDELFAIEQPTVRPTNGCLARIAPVAVRYWKQPDTMSEIAARQARTTHGGDGVEELSRSFAEAIALAIADHGRTALLSGRFWEKRWGRTLTFGELSQVPEDRILSDEDARGSFDAALWCVATGDGFNGALLNARNLGGDATSIGAMAGQLAGAIYGARAIRRDWLECIAGRESIERAALKLFDAGMAEAGSS
jgi:ADP-ribosylglycohydrolase